MAQPERGEVWVVGPTGFPQWTQPHPRAARFELADVQLQLKLKE